MIYHLLFQPSQEDCSQLKFLQKVPMNPSIVSLPVDMTNFSTSERFHGQRYVSTVASCYHDADNNQWASLKDRTAAPYTLSLKSNGCIIFIAALSPSKLLITSKHSIGPVAGNSLSHAQAGEQWIRTYLAEKGRTEADIASVLWESNWTAIAEVCFIFFCRTANI